MVTIGILGKPLPLAPKSHVLPNPLREPSHRDPMQALLRSEGLLSHFDAAIARARGHSAMLSVLSVDLSDFRCAGTRFVRPDGDQVITELANRMRGCARRSDLVARLDGDVYLIIAEFMEGPFAAHRLADRILSILQLPLTQMDPAAGGKASIGVATASSLQLIAETLLRRAHRAMLRARAAGGNRRIDADAPL